MTTKLFWEDPHLMTFTAHVLESSIQNNQQVIVLDQTAFYPLGGGQPCDFGLLDSARVSDVLMQENGSIHHYLNEPINLSVGQEVVCQIDATRRQEMTQQHTGQHILSQAFFQLFGAETRGFRLNSRSSEIDLALDFPLEKISAAICEAEDLANRIVFENRSIRTHLATPAEAAKLPLRRESFITDCVRIIEIEGFDWSACGGTHANQTGEVGLILVKGWERAKKMLRLEFLCGVRALSDCRLANATAETIARKFSVERNEAIIAVSRLIEERGELERRNRSLLALAAKVEAAALLEEVVGPSNFRCIVKTFVDRDLLELKLLAHALVKSDSVVALLAVQHSDTAKLVFARSANLSIEMNALMREACQLFGGKGGGTADFAQGGIEKVGDLDSALTSIAEKLV